ncbi:alpha/beta fold hydrolase [Lysobacter sp. TY2-98]|uniref:alpha/beta fold hydrolase n=1 Tax=Lysobacter sp. TY2-98 TaxID=2290922 RepID=UPI000E2007C5|nr:alpha/beta fold hydrolase [Lysobacter sp. TY2-98]AXK72644.1 alpha/beta fold hydrolase [Lysobacter sp. TY2-98]
MPFLRLVRRVVFVVLATALLYICASVAWVEYHERVSPRTAAPAGGRFIDVDGVSVFVQVSGPASGAPVLLVHGTGAWSGTWFSLVPALTHGGYRVIAVDLPPFGYSSKSTRADYSRPAQAMRLQRVLDALRIPKARVVGHSFGGGPALELALTAPKRVERLVLVDAALALDAPPNDPDTVACRLLAHGGRQALLASTATNPLWSRALLRSFVARKDAVTDARLAAYREPLQLRNTTDALGAWAHAFACDARTGLSTHADNIAGLTPPLTLIWGDADTITPIAQAEHLKTLVPGARLEVLHGVGHIPHLEDPASFEPALLRALAQAPATSR